MRDELYEEVHYVVREHEPIEREVAPLEERLPDPNLWQGVDWHCYRRGESDGNLGLASRYNNPFYILGYKKAQKKYQSPKK